VANSPTLTATGWAWGRGLIQREGLLRGTGTALRALVDLGLDYLPSRKRLRYGDIDFDFEHGVNTTWAAPTLAVRLRETFTRGKYQPSEPGLFRRILDELKIDHGRFTFIDLGSGKGRTLLMASDYPFRRIIGAEIIPELHEIALNNLKRYRSERQKCFVLEAWLGDAREFPFPNESMVVYLFNPFPADVLGIVLENLGKSLATLPRETYVIYHNLVHEGVFHAMPFLKEMQRTEQYVIYRAN
jgi:SAM-dependent methyltransferase